MAILTITRYPKTSTAAQLRLAYNSASLNCALKSRAKTLSLTCSALKLPVLMLFTWWPPLIKKLTKSSFRYQTSTQELWLSCRKQWVVKAWCCWPTCAASTISSQACQLSCTWSKGKPPTMHRAWSISSQSYHFSLMRSMSCAFIQVWLTNDFQIWQFNKMLRKLLFLVTVVSLVSADHKQEKLLDF